MRWIDEWDDEAGVTLRHIWSDDQASPGDCIRSFDEALPSELFGRGARSTRLDCGSYLMMALGPNRYPPIRLTRFEKTYKRLGYPESQGEDLGGEYEHALLFLDDLVEQAKSRGMARPGTRLDAQSVVWSLSFQSPSADAGDGSELEPEKAARDAWQHGKGTEHNPLRTTGNREDLLDGAALCRDL